MKHVASIPILATGKLDLRACQKLAAEQNGTAAGMNILGVGMDIVETKRIADSLERFGDRFLHARLSAKVKSAYAKSMKATAASPRGDGSRRRKRSARRSAPASATPWAGATSRSCASQAESRASFSTARPTRTRRSSRRAGSAHQPLAYGGVWRGQRCRCGRINTCRYPMTLDEFAQLDPPGHCRRWVR